MLQCMCQMTGLAANQAFNADSSHGARPKLSPRHDSLARRAGSAH
jgi:hypothetical protein